MARTLDVYLHRALVGQLIQDDNGQMVFDYAESWLNNPDAIPISHSLPLQSERFKRNQCRGFFAGILPEESKRDQIARNLGISNKNDFAMLEQIGGECAGAITFVPAGETLPEEDYRYRTLTDGELADILRQLPRKPLMAGEEGVRLSLAGAQDKLPVHVSGGKVSLPLGSAPSTHIIKPAIERFKDTVTNEAFCMMLADAVGISSANVSTHKVEDVEYLLVERYDRHMDNGKVMRVHQEDFCQALGVASEMKYQCEGGPTLKHCFNLLREVAAIPFKQVKYLLDIVIFNCLVGNNDAHAKNFSLVFVAKDIQTWKQAGFWESEVRWLAPAYDILCTALYPELDKKMAMKLGGEYLFENLYPKQFETFAADCGLAKALVKQRAVELATKTMESLDVVAIEGDSIVELKKLISARCQTILERLKSG